MSELKTYDVIMTPSDDGNWVLKSEADRYIAHHKYKRCLAMAEWCESEACYQEMYIMDDKKATWFFNWEYKWRKLAEKFNPNNSTAQ